MPPRPTPPPGGPPKRRSAPAAPNSWLWLVLVLIVVGAVVLFKDLGGYTEIGYSKFNELVKKDPPRVSKVTFVGPDRINGEIKEEFKEEASKDKDYKIRGGKFTVRLPPSENRVAFADELAKKGIEVSTDEEQGAWLGPFLMIWLPILLIGGLFFLIFVQRFRDPMGGGFLSNYIKSPARRYERSKVRVTFEDVANMTHAKAELQEVVDFLKTPDKFQRLGAQVPKGVLLVGPPGTGKTLLARAVAGEAGVPFFSISGSEFIQLFVGVGASRVRDMFKTAKENSPCLLFIDEIDAVGRMRGAGIGGGSDEREQTLNQILSEMDGFQPTEMVIVLAATNRPDVLDAALLRPGRFDRHVTIDRPTWHGRMEILKVHTRNKPLADDVNLEQIARKMIGMTGADLRNLANEAALIATRDNKAKIERSDFERAADRVMMGPKREELISPDGKRRTAYHESGHALVSWYEPHADPPQKVSIIPRGRALGVTITPPEEERYHHGLDYWKASLAVMMGGRAADRMIYNQPFSGQENDLKQATRLARYMVTHWGMSDKLGPMSFRIGEEHVFLGKEIQEQRDFSETTAALIDEEVQRLLREAEQRAFEVLDVHRIELDKVVEALLQKEELYREELEQVLGQSPASLNGRPEGPGSVIAPPTPVLGGSA